MPKKSKIQTGDVVYIRKNEATPDTLPPPVPVPSPEPVPEPTPPVIPEPVPSIAPTTLQKQRTKRPLTEGRKEHLARLAELNRKRREEAKKPPAVEIPEPPGDTVRMTVRPKRTYTKKDKDFWEHITTAEEKRRELEGLTSQNEVIYPVVELEKPKPKAKAKAQPQPKPTRPLKAPPKPRKSREDAMPRSLPLRRQSGYYGRKSVLSDVEDDDEEDSEESEESESDEEEVERVVRKTHKRLSTLEKIDRRLKDLQNPYAVRGLSVF